MKSIHLTKGTTHFLDCMWYLAGYPSRSCKIFLRKETVFVKKVSREKKEVDQKEEVD